MVGGPLTGCSDKNCSDPHPQGAVQSSKDSSLRAMLPIATNGTTLPHFGYGTGRVV
jgi:hypothetical protein